MGPMHKKIGRLRVERDFVSQKVWTNNRPERLALVNHDDPTLPAVARCRLLKVSEALREAMERFGQPDIFNTGQGAQSTSADFVGGLIGRKVRISMDGRCRYLDNILSSGYGGT
jgi:transposase InsO family protein